MHTGSAALDCIHRTANAKGRLSSSSRVAAPPYLPLPATCMENLPAHFSIVKWVFILKSLLLSPFGPDNRFARREGERGRGREGEEREGEEREGEKRGRGREERGGGERTQRRGRGERRGEKGEKETARRIAFLFGKRQVALRQGPTSEHGSWQMHFRLPWNASAA